jgi:hypothetical protein
MLSGMNFSRIRRLAAVLTVAAAATAAPATANALPSAYNVAIGTSWTYSTGVLDVAGGSVAAGAKVIQYPITGGANQRWNFVSGRLGAGQIVNAKSGLCLTTSGVAGQQLYVTYCNDANPRQLWDGSVPYLSYNLGNNDLDYGEIYNPFTGLRVDLQGGSRNAGTPIIGWYDNDRVAQDFTYWYWN